MPVSQGIACRNDSGEWSTIVSIHPPVDPVATESDPAYFPAGGEKMTDIILSQMMASPPMSLQRESELIKQRWAAAPTPEPTLE